MKGVLRARARRPARHAGRGGRIAAVPFFCGHLPLSSSNTFCYMR